MHDLKLTSHDIIDMDKLCHKAPWLFPLAKKLLPLAKIHSLAISGFNEERHGQVPLL